MFTLTDQAVTILIMNVYVLSKACGMAVTGVMLQQPEKCQINQENGTCYIRFLFYEKLSFNQKHLVLVHF